MRTASARLRMALQSLDQTITPYTSAVRDFTGGGFMCGREMSEINATVAQTIYRSDKCCTNERFNDEILN